MKVIWRIGFSTQVPWPIDFSRLGVKLDIGPLMGFFEIAESHPAYKMVLQLIESGSVSYSNRSEFTPTEISSARYCKVLPEIIQGYPHPSDDGSYRVKTYQAGSSCDSCHKGLVQIAPFRIAKVPRLARRKAFSLFWVYDEIFVDVALYSGIFARFGLESREVLTPRGLEIAGIRQMIIPVSRRAEIETSPEMFEPACAGCGSSRLRPNLTGFFPRLKHQPEDLPIFKLDQWVGSGGQSWRPILFSGKVIASLRTAGDRSFNFTPIGQ